MPSAGGVTAPTIIPLRKSVPGGKLSTHIDTATYIELNTGLTLSQLPLLELIEWKGAHRVSFYVGIVARSGT